jgi:hypothetical protein
VYLTSEGAVAFDAEKAAASAKKKAMRRIEAMGLTASDYEAAEAELTEQFGSPAGAGDVYWSLANQQLLLLGDPRRNGYEMSQIRWQMALHLKEEGRPAANTLKLAHKERLWYEQAKIADIDDEAAQWRTVAIANGCCDVCKQFDGRTYTFEQAIEEMPLPPDDCTSDWCNCSWSNQPP